MEYVDPEDPSLTRHCTSTVISSLGAAPGKQEQQQSQPSAIINDEQVVSTFLFLPGPRFNSTSCSVLCPVCRLVILVGPKLIEK